MGTSREALRKTLIWSYERGTLQYDIICGLILAFVFFVPPKWLVKPRAEVQSPSVRTVKSPPAGSNHSEPPSRSKP